MSEQEEINKLKQEIEALKNLNNNLVKQLSDIDLYKNVFYNSSSVQIVFNQQYRIHHANYFPIPENQKIIDELLGQQGYFFLQCLFEFGSSPDSCERSGCNNCPVASLVDDCFRHQKNIYQQKIKIELRLEKKQASQYFMASANYIHSANEPFVLITLNDITEKEKIQLQLENSEQRFRKYFTEDKSVKLLISATDGKILDANPAAIDFYKYSPEEIKQLTINDINTLPANEIAAEMKAAFARESNFFVFQHQTASGITKDVEVYAAPMHIDNKDVMYVTVHDITESTRYKTRLQQANERFKHLLNNIDAYIYLVDIETQKIVYTNKLVRKAFGNIIGQHCWESFAMGTNECRMCQRKKMDLNNLNTNDSVSGENYVPKLNKWLSYHDRVIRWTNDRLVRISISYDITERVEAKQQLQKSKQRLQQALDGANDGLWDWNITTNQIYFSPRWKQMLGYADNEIEDSVRAWKNRIHPDDVGAVSAKLHECKHALRCVFEVEYRMLHKNNNWYTFLSRAKVQTSKYTGDKHLIGTQVDITQLRKTEKALKQSEHFLKSAQEVGHIGSWLYDAETNLLKWSDEEYRIFGIRPQSDFVKYEDFDALVHPDDKTLLDTIWEKSLLDGSPFEIEFRILVDGKTRWIYERANRIEDNQNRVQILGVSQDITEQKRKENLLKNLNAELQQTVKSRDRMFSIIAHDLRSPFNAILGFSQLIGNYNKQLNDPKLAKYHNMQQAGIEKALDLLENLLQWARQQRGVLKPQMQWFKFNDTAKSVIEIYKNAACQKQITLHEKLCENTTIYSDEKMVNTILRNFIANAIKFTKPNGSISVECFVDDENNFVFQVTDTGLGMTTEQITKVLDPEVIHTTVGTNNEKGSGLGLKLCKDLTNHLNGEFSIESEPDKYSKFMVKIPQTNTKPRQAE